VIVLIQYGPVRMVEVMVVHHLLHASVRINPHRVELWNG
jgi:hypothetical protein